MVHGHECFINHPRGNRNFGIAPTGATWYYSGYLWCICPVAFTWRAFTKVMWHHSYSPFALISNPNPSQNPHQYPKSYPTPNPFPNPNPTVKWSLFSRLAKHKSRDLLKSSFLLIAPQGCILTLRHAGWFRISVKKYVYTHLKISKILIYKDFRRVI